MAAVRNCYLAFCLMVITTEPLKLGTCSRDRGFEIMCKCTLGIKHLWANS